jgi:hypothetical protein
MIAGSQDSGGELGHRRGKRASVSAAPALLVGHAGDAVTIASSYGSTPGEWGLLDMRMR